MAVTVAMPQLGETVTEGTILSWAKQVGDTIAEDEVLLEISTDKVDTEVPSPAAGTIQEILVPAGETVSVGTPLVVIGDGDAAPAPQPEGVAGDAPPPPPPPPGAGDQPAADQERVVEVAVEAAGPEPAPAEPPAAQPTATQPTPAAQPQPQAEAQTEPQGAAAAGESVTVDMPQLGETVTEGTILSWAKQVGDTIAEDEVLLEISTDKVDTEIPSPAAGVIQEILVPAGETVGVGTPLVVIGSGAASEAAPAPSEAPPPAGEASAQPSPAAEPAPAAPSTEPDSTPSASPAAVAPAAVPAAGVLDGPRRNVLSPVVRRLATEHGIDLTHVPGSGDGGRITRKDVMDYIDSGGAKVTFEPAAAQQPEPPAPATEPTAPAEPAPQAETSPVVPQQEPASQAPAAPTQPAPAQAEPVAAQPTQSQPAQAESAPEPAPAPAPAQPATAPATTAPQPAAQVSTQAPGADGDQVVQLSRLRTRIAENMINAKRTAAHVWASVEVDYERVERVRQAHKEAFKAREGFSLTYLPFVSRAVIDALEEFPVVNSSFRLDEGTQTFHSRVNLGIAVDMNQEGLVVVSVKDADGLRLAGIARSVREKALRARDGKLEPDDISGSTFTITNPGPYGSFMTAPIINVPNVAILSTDTVTKRAVVVTDEFGHDSIAIRHIGYLGLTWDHRAFDGSTAVLFLRRIKESIENWDWEQELA